MDEKLIAFVVFLLFSLTVGYYLFKFLQGDFTIESMEQVRSDTYILTSFGQPYGRETIIVYKVTYESGRIKYITKKYRH